MFAKNVSFIYSSPHWTKLQASQNTALRTSLRLCQDDLHAGSKCLPVKEYCLPSTTGPTYANHTDIYAAPPHRLVKETLVTKNKADIRPLVPNGAVLDAIDYRRE